MHPEAYAWVRACVSDYDLTGDVLEFGGRNINGGVRELFPYATWISIDIEPGPDVDLVADAATADCGYGMFDVVVSTEVFEHTPKAREIISNAYRHLRPNGWFVATMAGPGRAPHGAAGGDPRYEHYANIEPDALNDWLLDAGFRWFYVDVDRDDVRCIAQREKPIHTSSHLSA